MGQKEDIEREVVNFYERFFTGVQQSRPRLDGVHFKRMSSPKALLLESDFSEEDIREAVFSLHRDKASGGLMAFL